MVASWEAETRTGLPCKVKVMIALTKSAWPWYRFAVVPLAMDHDQIDLSQQPANRIPDAGETARDVKGAVGPAKVAVDLFVYGSVMLADAFLGGRA